MGFFFASCVYDCYSSGGVCMKGFQDVSPKLPKEKLVSRYKYGDLCAGCE